MKHDSPTLIRRYKRDSSLFSQSEPCGGAIVLLRGRVGLSMEIGRDQKFRIGYWNKGVVLGLCETLNDVAYETSAVASTSVTARFIPRRDVFSMIADDTSAGLQIVSMLAKDLAGLYQTIRSFKPQTSKTSKSTHNHG